MYTEIAPFASPFEGAPRPHWPDVYGFSPNKPALYRLPVSGARPMTFSCEGLPDGLTLDAERGVLTGECAREGEYALVVRVENALGHAERPLALRVSPDGVCRTPLMGWTSWNACGGTVTGEDIARAARLLAETGLADMGYQYVNIDSGWQGEYGEGDFIAPNARFPDMGALVAEIHARGLKAGIYETPMQKAWGGENLPGCTDGQLDPRFANVYYGIGQRHREAGNVRAWSEWGFDYLKYDWAPCDTENADRMKQCLLASPRDFAFCVTVAAGIEQADYWKANCASWRANGDSIDKWENVVKHRFRSDEWRAHVSAGHYLDMDMLETGQMVWSKGAPNALTPDEQLVAYSIRALFPSPIQISCDLGALTPFDLAMLGNDEVIAVNQDALGVAATCVWESAAHDMNGGLRAWHKVYARPLADGSLAAGFFNLGEEPARLALPLDERRCVRDLWAKKDLPDAEGELALSLPPHTVRLVRLTRP